MPPTPKILAARPFSRVNTVNDPAAADTVVPRRRFRARVTRRHSLQSSSGRRLVRRGRWSELIDRVFFCLHCTAGRNVRTTTKRHRDVRLTIVVCPECRVYVYDATGGGFTAFTAIPISPVTETGNAAGDGRFEFVRNDVATPNWVHPFPPPPTPRNTRFFQLGYLCMSIQIKQSSKNLKIIYTRV